MASNKYYLGDLIKQRREKNPGGDLPIRGVSKDGLQPPKQIDADTSIYNVYYRNDFIFNPARMELGSIAFNNEYDKAICSSLYEVFYVYRTDLVIPEYLALFVKNPEFARYCNYIGNGSAREYCRFDNISEIPIVLPSLPEQRKIVHDYKVITDRIELLRKMNENLEGIAFTHFQDVFAKAYTDDTLPDGWMMGTLDDVCDVKGGKRLPADCELTDTKTSHPYIRVRDVGASRYVCLTDQYQYIDDATYEAISRYIVNTGDIVISIVGTIGLIGKIHKSLDGANLTENCVRLTHIKSVTSDYLYYTLQYKKQTKEIELLTVGAVQAKLPMYNIQGMKVVIPDEDVLASFQERINAINSIVEANTAEMQSLTVLAKSFFMVQKGA